jgi:hypothetical protein
MNPRRLLPFPPALAAGLGLALLGAACGSPVKETRPAVVVEFHAGGNVRNPAAHDAYPGVRRVVLRAVDGRTRPDAIARFSDRVTVPAGERSLLFAAETETGKVTLSELKLELERGRDHVVWPVVLADGTVVAEVKSGPYGATLGRSTPRVAGPEAQEQSEAR